MTTVFQQAVQLIALALGFGFLNEFAEIAAFEPVQDLIWKLLMSLAFVYMATRAPRRGAFEIGVIRVLSNPGPDAEDRLRRLMSLIVSHATRGEKAGPDKDSPSDAPTGEPRPAVED